MSRETRISGSLLLPDAERQTNTTCRYIQSQMEEDNSGAVSKLCASAPQIHLIIRSCSGETKVLGKSQKLDCGFISEPALARSKLSKSPL